MKYIITWTDTGTGENKRLEVHSARSVQEVKDTLARQPWRHENVQVTAFSRVRVRDVIIKFEH